MQTLPAQPVAGDQRADLPEPVDVAAVDAIVSRIGDRPECLISLLRAIQGEYGFLPEEALLRLAACTPIRPATISAVATFFTLFRHRPGGCHTIGVCVGTACHVKGAEAVYDAFLRRLGIAPGEDTDPQRQFTIEKVACLGCCTLAPAVQIGRNVYGHVHPNTVGNTIRDYLDRIERQAATVPEWTPVDASPIGEVRLGLGSCCQARGSAAVLTAVQQALAASGRRVTVKQVGCVGICSLTPLMEVLRPGADPATYTRVDPEQARRIIHAHFRPAGVLRRARHAARSALERLYGGNGDSEIERFEANVRDPAWEMQEFLRPQKRIATECCGELDPLDWDEYRRGGGFLAMERCVRELGPEDVLRALTESGLRGRGGAGYPTGRKWRQVFAAGGSPKYVVCNGDEGDPGAFMDRMLLESYPFRVLEGVTIACWVLGAADAYLYVRAEYPLAVERATRAIAAMEQEGLLGENVLGSGRALRIHIVEGAGAFVCGEETALLASIEGRRGMPRPRPPYPAESGLWGRPTLVNNVETYASIPWILRHGAAAYAAMGTEHSKGTKVFALAGKVYRGGLIEVPMGITLGEVVQIVGGGVAPGRTFKAAQIGGPSGGCIPAALSDTPIDYEALTRVGAIMGSGGIVVLDNTDCMVDIARYFLEFTQAQSCGRCAPCRIGTRRMLDILEDLCGGKARPEAVQELEDLAHMVKRTSLCGLGQTAPNPVLSTLMHFRDEYDAHLEGRCPAGKCKALIHYAISDRCIGCTLCAQNCPVGAIDMRPFERHIIHQELCVRCGSCRENCPEQAIDIHSGGQVVAGRTANGIGAGI
ncbi:MAG: NAD(P)H-dependent oxidoreductase subunit E, partial [Lentisphaeria bacterium]|nr:NAD(P)H-dependent oxidoreductase subunit E [Lentisphaeria bacterium]